jgi:hypothetical protein
MEKLSGNKKILTAFLILILVGIIVISVLVATGIIGGDYTGYVNGDIDNVTSYKPYINKSPSNSDWTAREDAKTTNYYSLNVPDCTKQCSSDNTCTAFIVGGGVSTPSGANSCTTFSAPISGSAMASNSGGYTTYIKN